MEKVTGIGGLFASHLDYFVAEANGSNPEDVAAPYRRH